MLHDFIRLRGKQVELIHVKDHDQLFAAKNETIEVYKKLVAEKDKKISEQSAEIEELKLLVEKLKKEQPAITRDHDGAAGQSKKGKKSA